MARVKDSTLKKTAVKMAHAVDHIRDMGHGDVISDNEALILSVAAELLRIAPAALLRQAARTARSSEGYTNLLGNEPPDQEEENGKS